MPTWAELGWLAVTSLCCGLFVAAFYGLMAWAARPDDEPSEWSKLTPEERDYLRTWGKHDKA